MSSLTRRDGLVSTVALLLVGGCNVLFGVDESSLPPQDAAGSSGAPSGIGGGSGASAGGGDRGGGGGAGQSGGAGGAGQSGGGNGGQAGGGAAGGAGGAAGPPSRLDVTFGKGGVLTLRPGGVRALDYKLAALSMQPTGKLFVVGETRLKISDYSNVGRPNVFLALLDATGLGASFGGAAYTFLNSDQGGLPKRYDDKIRSALPDPQGAGAYVTVDYESTNAENNVNFGTRFWRVGADGTNNTSSPVPAVTTFLASSAGCVAARTYTSEGPAERGVEFAVCPPPGAGSPVYDKRVPLTGLYFLSLADEDSGYSDVRVSPLVTTTGHVFLVVASTTGGQVGVVKFRHEGGSSVVLESAFGYTTSGLALAKPDAFDPALNRTVKAAATSAAGDVYLAGQTQISDSLVPFLVKFRNNGVGLDLGFSVNVVQSEGISETAWACLQLDDQGRLLAAGERGGQPWLYRFTPEGRADESFEPGGRLPLPFAPQRCTLDGEGRLLVAGRHADAFGVPTVSVTRLRLDDAARGADAPPDTAPEPCASLDLDEPNGEPIAATFMRSAFGANTPIHQLRRAMWTSVLDGANDRDWLRYKVAYDDTYSDPAPSARVESAVPIEVCLYMSAIEGLRCDPPRVADTTTLPGLLGCCDTNATALTYVMPSPPPSINTDVYLRLSKLQSGAGTCDVYQAVGEF